MQFAGGTIGGGAQPGKRLLYFDTTLKTQVVIDQATAPVQLQQLKAGVLFNKPGGLQLTGDQAETTASDRITRIEVLGNTQNLGQTTEPFAPFAVKLDTDRYLMTSNAQGSLRLSSENIFNAVQASRSIGTPASNQVTYTARRGGTPGNNITVSQVFNGGLSAGTCTVTPSITDAATDTVDIVVAYNAIAANLVAAAVNADAVASRFVFATNSGTGNVVAGSSAALAGGQIDATVSGNLTIQGQTTTVSTTHLVVTDPVIFLNKDAVTATTSGGVAFSRGGGGNYDALWFWNETDDRFELGYANTSTGTINPTALLSFRPLKAAWSIYPDNAGNPATITSHGQVFTKTISAVNELCYLDDQGNFVQITSGGSVNAGGSSSGTTNLSYTINSDGAAGVNEQAFLNLLSGNGTTNLYTGTLRQQSTGAYAGALAAFTRVNGSASDNWLVVGEPISSGTGRFANLSLIGTNGSATAFEARFSYAPGTDASTVYFGTAGDATNLVVRGNYGFSNVGNGIHYLQAQQAASTAGVASGGDGVIVTAGRGQPRTAGGGSAGIGGDLSVGAADGGAGTGGANGGTGGTLNLYGGSGGSATGGGSNGVGGSVAISGGFSPGGGSPGNITIGNSNTTNVNLGGSAVNVIVDSAVAQFRTPHVRFPELASDPTNVANTGFMYTKDYSGRTELVYRDDTGAVVQITNAGAVNGGGGSSSGTSSLTYTINNDATGTESAALVLSSANSSALRNATLTQFATGTTGLSRTNAGTATSVQFLLNVPSTGVASLTSTLSFFGTTAGAADRQADLIWPVTGNALVLGTDLQGFTGNTTAAFTLATQSNQNIALSPNGTGIVSVSSSMTVAGTTLTGSNAGGLSIITSASNQNIALTPNGTGSVVIGKNLIFSPDATYRVGTSSSAGRPIEVHVSDAITLGDTVLSLSILAGNLVATSSGAMSFTTATNSNLNLTAQGTGNVVVSAPVLRATADTTTALGTASQRFTNLFLSGYVRLTESSDPTAVADTGFLYTKDVAGNTEAFFRDSAGNAVQLTNNGSVNAGGSTPSKVAISSLTNTSGVTVNQGAPVYINGSGTFSTARANAAAASTVFGIVSATTIANGATGEITVSGVVVIPNAAQTGTWVAGDIIYLDDATAGKLTNVLPTTPGTYVVEIGVCANTPSGSNATLVLCKQNKVLN